DDVALVQRLGRSVHIVEGSPANMKVTTPDDWELAQALWRHLSTET
ncbi:MAG: 2-C-methyl-D-erythritol 4-phosphate cytidylyltransferase, partial [Rhodothermales bacterium]